VKARQAIKHECFQLSSPFFVLGVRIQLLR
jgi:hypothetical protein